MGVKVSVRGSYICVFEVTYPLCSAPITFTGRCTTDNRRGWIHPPFVCVSEVLWLAAGSTGLATLEGIHSIGREAARLTAPYHIASICPN